MSTTQHFVSIFTITYNQKERVVLTVESMLRQDYPKDRYEIIVLDDGSTDGTEEPMQALAQKYAPAVKYLRHEHKADYMNALRWNQAIEAVRSETQIIIQVDDILARPDFIKQHIKWHTQNKDYLVTGAKFEADEETYDLNTCKRVSLAGKNGEAKAITVYKAVWGASMSYTKKMIEKVSCLPYDKPYDERMVGWGYHEVEFAYRMRENGATIIYDPSAGVFHKNHEQCIELKRGIDREKAVERDASKNIKYVLQKHNLKEIEAW